MKELGTGKLRLSDNCLNANLGSQTVSEVTIGVPGNKIFSKSRISSSRTVNSRYVSERKFETHDSE